MKSAYKKIFEIFAKVMSVEDAHRETAQYIRYHSQDTVRRYAER